VKPKPKINIKKSNEKKSLESNQVNPLTLLPWTYDWDNLI
jgi:hypothetical protein